MRPKTAAFVSWGVAGGLAVIVSWLVLACLILANILDIDVVTTPKIWAQAKSHLMEWWQSMERKSSLAGHHQGLAHLPALTLAQWKGLSVSFLGSVFYRQCIDYTCFNIQDFDQLRIYPWDLLMRQHTLFYVPVWPKNAWSAKSLLNAIIITFCGRSKHGSETEYRRWRYNKLTTCRVLSNNSILKI